MRISIVTGPWYSVPPAPCGAVERVWHGLALKFAARGHDVTLLCRAYGDLPPEETRDGVRYIRRTKFSITQKLPVDIAKDFFYTLRMLGHLPKADVLVTNNIWMPLTLGRISKKWGRIVQSVARMPKGQMKFYLKTGRLTAVSHAVGREILKQCPAARDIVTVIPNPIDTDIFNPGPPKQSASGGKVILYAGRVHPEKGLDLLMNAFRKVHQEYPTVTLKLVGPQQIDEGGGGEAYVAKLRELAGPSPVEFCRPVYQRQALADIYRSADVFIYPSVAEKGEASPVAPLEAMGTGLVTVVSDLEQFRDYLTPGVNGLMFNHRAPDPVGALAGTLLEALKDDRTASRLSTEAATSAQRFSYDSVAQMYLDDWQCMLNGTRSDAFEVGPAPFRAFNPVDHTPAFSQPGSPVELRGV